MIRNYTQKGSAHVVIVIVLVAALLGALGFIFWQNFMKEKPATDQTSTNKTETTPKLLTASFNEGFKANTSFSYPENWTLERSVTGSFPVNLENGATSEEIKITSPSKKYSAHYRISAHAGIGGACPEEDIGVVKQVRSEPANLKPEENNFTEAIATNDAEKFVYYAGLMSRDVTKDTSACELSFAVLTQLGDLEDGTPVDLFEASVHIEGLNDPSNLFEGNGVATIAEIEAKFKDAEFNQAKAIIVSTKNT